MASRIPISKLSLFGDNLKSAFIGIFLDEEQNRAFLYMRCNLYRQFDVLKAQLDEWHKEGSNKTQDELSALVNELATVIADDLHDRRRFVFGNPNRPFKNCNADVIHTFPNDASTYTSTSMVSSMSNVHLHQISIFYAQLLQINGAITSMEKFVDSINTVVHDHTIKWPIKFIESLDINEGIGYVY